MRGTAGTFVGHYREYNMSQDKGGQGAPGSGPKPKDIKVTITYLPARRPLQLEVPPTTTVGALKAQALEAFKEKEGPTPDGQGQIVFSLFDDERQLTDLDETIGAVVGKSGHAKLKLVKQIVQG
jgi:hypothetical protein